MKFVLFVVLGLVVASNANFISRKCACRAVSDTIHFPFNSWDISSCKFCSCSDAAMAKCEAACQSTVQNYANTGCGVVTKGSKVVYSFEASNCGSGYGSNVYTCA